MGPRRVSPTLWLRLAPSLLGLLGTWLAPIVPSVASAQTVGAAAVTPPAAAGGAESGSHGGANGGADADKAGEGPYRALVKTAIAEMELGNYPEAHSLFLRAHRMAPSARTLRGLGLTLFEMRRYVEAERQLAAALASEDKPLAGQVRASTQALHARARQYIGTLWLTLSPGTASVLVDQARRPDERVGLAPTGEARPLYLNAGEHMLEVRARGYASEKRRVLIAGGQTKRLSLALTPMVTAGAGHTAAMPDTPADGGGAFWTSPWLWAGAGLVVAGFVVGAVVLGGDPAPVETGRYGGSADTRLVGP